MRRIPVPVLVLFAAGALHWFASAQQTPAVQSMAASEAQQICTREFGDQFKLDPKFAPITADLDGDGQEDLVLVATAKNALSGEMDYHYRAIDPYDGYFGWSNAKDTLQFSATNAGTTRYVLVVHSWRTPKGKFVIVNLPFDSLSAGRMPIKRKKTTVNTIHAVEYGGLGADIYWDGKKYRWEPTSSGQD
jgi:hypothetical protein